MSQFYRGNINKNEEKFNEIVEGIEIEKIPSEKGIQHIIDVISKNPKFKEYKNDFSVDNDIGNLKNLVESSKNIELTDHQEILNKILSIINPNQLGGAPPRGSGQGQQVGLVALMVFVFVHLLFFSTPNNTPNGITSNSTAADVIARMQQQQRQRRRHNLDHPGNYGGGRKRTRKNRKSKKQSKSKRKQSRIKSNRRRR